MPDWVANVGTNWTAFFSTIARSFQFPFWPTNHPPKLKSFYAAFWFAHSVSDTSTNKTTNNAPYLSANRSAIVPTDSNTDLSTVIASHGSSD